MIMAALGSRNPEKNYDKVAWGDVIGALLATDYKSPPVCLILYDDETDSPKCDQ